MLLENREFFPLNHLRLQKMRKRHMSFRLLKDKEPWQQNLNISILLNAASKTVWVE
jgi:hypothetical protein